MLKLLMALASITCLTNPANAQSGKQDILGLSLGMTSADVTRLAQAQSWPCHVAVASPFGDDVYDCQTKLGGVVLKFTRSLDGMPLIWMRLFFNSAEPRESIIQSISTQYGREGKTDSSAPDKITWELGPGRFLQLTLGGSQHMLDLIAADLVKKAKQAEQDKNLREHPTPKF